MGPSVSRASTAGLQCEVPQGSVLGPIPFAVSMLLSGFLLTFSMFSQMFSPIDVGYDSFKSLLFDLRDF